METKMSDRLYDPTGLELIVRERAGQFRAEALTSEGYTRYWSKWFTTELQAKAQAVLWHLGRPEPK